MGTVSGMVYIKTISEVKMWRYDKLRNMNVLFTFGFSSSIFREKAASG